MESKKVATIGRCSGCMRGAQLVADKTCAKCARLHPTFGLVAEKIRSKLSLKRACFEALKSEMARREFVNMFGEVV